MRLLSINIGSGKTVSNGARTTTTGINKLPVLEAEIYQLGLNGDLVSDKKNHGGADQAVYVYSADDYAWWAEQLGSELEPGTFGENLTFSTFPNPVRIGDRFELGGVVLEVTAPRIPCWVLANRMGDVAFVKKFRDGQRPGVYTRVIQGGKIKSDIQVQHHPASGQNPTLLEVYNLWFNDNPSVAELEHVLSAPLAERARKQYAEALASLKTPR